MRAISLSIPVLSGLALLAACAPVRDTQHSERADRELARELDGRTAGEPQRCVTTSRLGNANIVGTNLLYRDGRTLWVNRVPDCPMLGGDPLLVFEMHGNQSCENDMFRTMPRGSGMIPGPYCRLGKFEPFTKPR